MTTLCAGDMLADGSILVEINEDDYAVTNPQTGNFVMYERINGYKEHDMLLAHPGNVFCPHCGEEVECEEDDYPYVRMLHDLPNECNKTDIWATSDRKI